MNAAELQERYKRIYRIIQRERFMRMEVFKTKPDKQAEKVGEMDVLLKDITAIKDALKAHLQPAEQAALFDLPGPAPQRAELL